MFPSISVSENSFEQGLTHGEALAHGIAKNLDVYFYQFQQECHVGKDEVLSRAKRYLQKIKGQSVDYFAGMQGIAAGSGADLIEIAALNVRYEILYYQYAQRGLTDGCTSIAITNERLKNNQVILAQNWDWFPEASGAIIQAHHPNGVTSIAFTEAGIFGGKIGLNSSGIGLLINGLISLEHDWGTLRKPFHVRCYEILLQQSIGDAFDIVTNEPRACSANFLIGSSSGKVFNIEAAPQTFAVYAPQNGLLVHTNHFIDPDLVGVSEPVEERIHTEFRYQRVQKIARQHLGHISQQHVESWLKDHSGFPNSVCQHQDITVPEYEQYETVASIILNLSTQTMSISSGPPCESEYNIYCLQPEDLYV